MALNLKKMNLNKLNLNKLDKKLNFLSKNKLVYYALMFLYYDSK